MRIIALPILLFVLTCAQAHAAPLCTIVLDAQSTKTLVQQGNCDTRVTPASTFKIALAAIGFDTGVLKDAQTPKLPFRKGYPEWGGDNWRQATTPARWMKYSVVWYSQQITPQIGQALITDFLKGFQYGNADFTGDAFRSNGLERAWLTSSLLISPREQSAFLAKFLKGELPIASSAIENTVNILQGHQTAAGWRIKGKTGTAYPRDDTGRFNYDNGWGWYVGWAEKGGKTVVFAHLLQDTARQNKSPGKRAERFIATGFDALALEFEQ